MVPFPGEESDNFIMHILRIMAMLVEYWEGTQGKTSHCSSVESGGCLDRCARRGYLLIQKGRRHRHHKPHPSTHRQIHRGRSIHNGTRNLLIPLTSKDQVIAATKMTSTSPTLFRIYHVGIDGIQAVRELQEKYTKF